MKAHLLLKSFEDLPVEAGSIPGISPAQVIDREVPSGILIFQGSLRTVNGGHVENSETVHIRTDAAPGFDCWMHGGLNE
jgi:hypothetical protein